MIWLGELSMMELVIWAVYGGFVLSCLYMIYNNVYLGSFVRALLKAGAHSPETALTVRKSGVFLPRLIIHSLRRDSSPLYKVLRPEGMEDRFPSPQKFRIDAASARFYIPEPLRIRAEIRFDRRGSGIVTAVIVILAAAVAAYLLARYLPELLEWFESFFPTSSEIEYRAGNPLAGA